MVETNPITADLRNFDPQEQVGLDDPRLDKIVRLRLLSERGYPWWDVSYCYGILKDGTRVRVQLPFTRFDRTHVHKGKKIVAPSLPKQLCGMCKGVGVFGKGLGIYSAVSTLA